MNFAVGLVLFLAAHLCCARAVHVPTEAELVYDIRELEPRVHEMQMEHERINGVLHEYERMAESEEDPHERAASLHHLETLRKRHDDIGERIHKVQDGLDLRKTELELIRELEKNPHDTALRHRIEVIEKQLTPDERQLLEREIHIEAEEEKWRTKNHLPDVMPEMQELYSLMTDRSHGLTTLQERTQTVIRSLQEEHAQVIDLIGKVTAMKTDIHHWHTEAKHEHHQMEELHHDAHWMLFLVVGSAVLTVPIVLKLVFGADMSSFVDRSK